VVVWFAVMWLAALAPVRGVDATNELKPESLRIGFTQNAFQSMNRNDVEASFKAFVETVGRKNGYLIAAQVQIFDDLAEYAAAIRSGAIQLAIVDAWNYQTMDFQNRAQPLFVSKGEAGLGRRYLMVARQDSGLNTLADLRGKQITLFSVANSNLGRYWLETLLLTNRLGTLAEFFGDVEVAGKPSLALLPVFFGKKSAGLVDEAGLKVMRELNPQVGKELKVLATSEPLVNSIIYLSTTGWSSETYRNDIIRGLAQLHEEPVGQQILTLFKVARLVPYEEQQLETIRRLRTTFDRLQKESKP